MYTISQWQAARGRHLRTAIGLLLILCLVGCQGYGSVSPTAYEYATALYGICNRKAESALEPLGKQIQLALEKKMLSEQEAVWLQEILADAQQKDWTGAASACRRMMQDQVKS